MKKGIIFLIIIIAVLSISVVFYIEGSLPVNRNDSSYKIITIQRGEPVDVIINDLYSQKLIRNKVVFFILIKQMGIDSKIQAGEFRLSPSMSAPEIAQKLIKGSYDTTVTIIEGLRKEEVAQIIARETNIPESEFIAQTQEGMLFPDTYSISKEASLSEILTMFQTNFDSKYSQELRRQARNKGLTDEEVITLASIVEREAKSKVDKEKVASILYKRWKEDWGLEVDATVQYILGYQDGEKTWWKKYITNTDKKIQSPYNTYAFKGLPPGPICNPGIDSIEAVINADQNTPYWFYISSKDGSFMHYAKTLEEHNNNIAKYLK